MTSRAFIVPLLAANLLGAPQALALEGARDEGDRVAHAPEAALAASRVATPTPRVDADERAPALTAPVEPLEAPAPVARPAPRRWAPHACGPDLHTCPSQGPPVAR